MLEVLNVIIAMCAIKSGSTSSAFTLEKQRECQKQLVLCVDQLKESDTQRHRDQALWKCAAK